jgi:hypothetical protein
MVYFVAPCEPAALSDAQIGPQKNIRQDEFFHLTAYKSNWAAGSDLEPAAFVMTREVAPKTGPQFWGNG